jgi:hypothetical protein
VADAHHLGDPLGTDLVAAGFVEPRLLRQGEAMDSVVGATRPQ